MSRALKFLMVGMVCLPAAALAQASPPVYTTAHGDWPTYTGDLAGTRYSPLDQINGSNFNDLEIAWRLKTDNFGSRPEYKLEGTPLEVGGGLYTTDRKSVV